MRGPMSFITSWSLRVGFPTSIEPTFVQVLRCMGAADLIEQTPEGLLITGLLGEKIVRSHDFLRRFRRP